MSNILELSGAQPQKQPKWTPIFIDRAFTGIWTQRNPLHDPSDLYTTKFYGGRPDALLDGSNIELTNKLTLARRPGLSQFSGAVYPTAPDTGFSFELTNGTIQVIIDTGSTGNLSITSVANASGSTAVYTGVLPLGNLGGYIGEVFLITGFTNTVNNGTYVCTASTTTTITLKNPKATAETISANAIAAGVVYYDRQDGTTQFLFGKLPGAGQTHFVGVAGVLYAGDGVSNWIYTPENPNGLVWFWGLTPPTVPPTISTVETGSSAVTWRASTIFSTMGLLVDSNGNVQQLQSVNASGTNTTRFGETGDGEPAWDLTPGTTTTETTGTPIVWTNFGPVIPWSAHTLFNNFSVGGTAAAPAFCYDPTTKQIFGNTNPANQPGTTGPTKPNFVGIPATGTFDPTGGGHPPGVEWYCLAPVSGWKPSTVYTQWATGIDGGSNAVLVPDILPPPTDQTIFLMVASNAGTSGTGGTAPPWATITGTQTVDNDLIWLNLGSATRVTLTPYTQWGGQGQAVFSVIEDSNSNLQVCTTSGISSATATASITWGTNYGDNTQDGTVIWTCVGNTLSWTANTFWYLPVNGFAPPQASQKYGGASVVDTNAPPDVEFVIESGLSGSSQPSWNGLNQTTTDNAVTWFNEAPYSQNGLAWSFGYNYAYSYASRTADDPFNTTTPPGWTGPLGPPTGSETGDISTASPVAVITGPNAGAINTISGPGSTNPAIDTIIIWRSADGGSSSQMFFLTEIPNPAVVGGAAGTWSFMDFLPDIATSLYPGLNIFEPAPINGTNNPPPTGFLPMVYNYERIWGPVGSTVYFSGGPDVLTGNPNSAFSIDDDIPFLASVIRLVKTTQGLVTFLTDSIEFILGGPLTTSFYSVTLSPGIGLMSYNALDVYAGDIYFFSADGQFKSVTTGLSLSNSGFPLGDKFAAFDPSKVYVAVQQSGVDNCIMVSDGSNGWYRQNPKQVPGLSNGPEPIWSPFANITGGCKMVQSIEISPGIKKLLVGATTGGHQILERNLTVFTDNGVPYDAFFVMGSIVLVHPGQLCVLGFIEADFSGVSYRPTVSFLLNEISGSFTPFTRPPQFDPPSLYGTTITPTSYSPNRYYFAGTNSLARCRHMQIKVDLGTTPNPDEMYNITIFGRIMVEL